MKDTGSWKRLGKGDNGRAVMQSVCWAESIGEMLRGNAQDSVAWDKSANTEMSSG